MLSPHGKGPVMRVDSQPGPLQQRLKPDPPGAKPQVGRRPFKQGAVTRADAGGPSPHGHPLAPTSHKTAATPPRAPHPVVGMGPLALVLIAFCTATPPLAAAEVPAPAPLSPIRSSDRSIHFFDAHGRVRIFHGAARVQKKPPWYFPDLLEGDTEARAMEALGFNVLRLGFMWSGYNPAPGVFNQSYIDVIKTTVAQLNAHGVYVLLDMHQDILSSAFCLYDGAPRWVIDKSVSAHPFPWPLKGNCSSRGWMVNEITEAAATAYQDIYDNKHGMLDDLSAFWSYSADQFKDEPAVIGYEIMNEPFAGNFYADPPVVMILQRTFLD